jgi:hypothetical protein
VMSFMDIMVHWYQGNIKPQRRRAASRVARQQWLPAMRAVQAS